MIQKQVSLLSLGGACVLERFLLQRSPGGLIRLRRYTPIVYTSAIVKSLGLLAAAGTCTFSRIFHSIAHSQCGERPVANDENIGQVFDFRMSTALFESTAAQVLFGPSKTSGLPSLPAYDGRSQYKRGELIAVLQDRTQRLDPFRSFFGHSSTAAQKNVKNNASS